MPAGTVRVDVSDVYDWYKLGQHISNMKGLGKHDFGKGPPSTIISFGSEEEEHKYLKDLQKLVGTRKVGNQNIVLKIFAEPQDFGKCHILFIPEKQSEQIEECIALLGTKPTVIITEKIGMAKRGSCINFLQDGDNIQFELNRTIATNIGVQVRNDLVKLAAVEIE
jgi:hypothetical protein